MRVHKYRVQTRGGVVIVEAKSAKEAADSVRRTGKTVSGSRRARPDGSRF